MNIGHFSPRDIDRPDLVMYKLIDGVLYFLVLESKENAFLFTEKSISNYIKHMRDYIENLLNMNYKHRGIGNNWTDWNKKIDNINSIKYNITFCFVAGSSNNEKELFSSLEYLNKVIKNFSKYDLFAAIISVGWDKLISFINVTYNNTVKLIDLPKEFAEFKY